MSRRTAGRSSRVASEKLVEYPWITLPAAARATA